MTSDELGEVSEEELATTPTPPSDLTHEEQVGWRIGWVHAMRAMALALATFTPEETE